ncbi:MAG: hypothetical protein AAF416_08375 [Pseudomonadota bacterium]
MMSYVAQIAASAVNAISRVVRLSIEPFARLSPWHVLLAAACLFAVGLVLPEMVIAVSTLLLFPAVGFSMARLFVWADDLLGSRFGSGMPSAMIICGAGCAGAFVRIVRDLPMNGAAE